MRLNRYLAASGVASRRGAEGLIRAGRVTVNGQAVSALATVIDPDRDRVEVDGRRVAPAERLLYLLLHKPVGFVSTARDPRGRPTVMTLVPSEPRVFAVGRLDRDTSGALLFTNDGILAYRLLHPRYKFEKEYEVQVEGSVDESALASLRSGVRLDKKGRPTAPAQAEITLRRPNRTWLRLVIREGRKRQVRKMLAAVGHRVIRLHRVRFGPIQLGDLEEGTSRELTPDEVAALRRLTQEAARNTPQESSKPAAAKRTRSSRAARARKQARSLLLPLVLLLATLGVGMGPAAASAMPAGAAGSASTAVMAGTAGSAGADGPPPYAVLSRTPARAVLQMELAYRSDGLLVRGFLFLPRAPGRHPAVVFNHGGIGGVSDDVKRRARDLARDGYVVFTPAYRGEDGSEGRVEVAAGEVNDVLAAARILARHPAVDSTRIAVAGSSHGALISVLAAAREPARFRCLIEACGVMDVSAWYRYLVENGFDVTDSLSVAVYGHGPEDKPLAFGARNALRVAPRIRVPVLIQQGAVDRIVPPEQARAFAAALRASGNRQVTRREYPLLGHAFWFWNDPALHRPEELAEADSAWADFTGFLSRRLGR